MRQVRLFLLSLSFLTRLAPAKAADSADMSSACLYYPLVGATLGLILTAPLYVGIFNGQFWVQSWCYLCLSAWLTRALHLDGIADIFDAFGSGKRGALFQEILKDSRLGAFGATALFLVLTGQLLCVAGLLADSRLAPLFFAPVFGRSLPIILACIAPPSPQASLGKLLNSAPKSTSLGLASACIVIGGLFCLGGITSFLLCLALGAAVLAFLSRVAKNNGGYNGDYFGAAIVMGELSILLGSLAAG